MPISSFCTLPVATTMDYVNRTPLVCSRSVFHKIFLFQNGDLHFMVSLVFKMAADIILTKKTSVVLVYNYFA